VVLLIHGKLLILQWSRLHSGLLPELRWAGMYSMEIGGGARRLLLFGLRSDRTINRARQGCALERDELRGATAGFGQTRPVRLHGCIFLQPRQRLAQYLCGSCIWRHRDAIVHPLAVAARLNHSGTAQIGQMPGDFGLALLQNLNKIADADLPVSHQVEQAEPRIVSQRLKKEIHFER